MCYPKPGPRCSSHAAAKLTLAKRTLKLSPRSFSGPDSYLSAKVAVQKAQDEYDTTPAGIAELMRRVAYNSNPDYVLRLERGQALRKAMLQAVKIKDVGDLKHKDNIRKIFAYDIQTLPSGDIVRSKVGNDSPEVMKMIAESENWGNAMTTNETEAVSWFTSNGSGAVNQYLVTNKPDDGGRYSSEHLDSTIKDMDSALNKFSRAEPVIVYRGISMDIVEHSGYDHNDEEKFLATEFPVGGVYRNKTFMSTSLDPSRAAGFASSSITLEIKSKKAAPVVNVSAWDISEKEMVIPRNQEYKVISIIRNAKIEGRNPADEIIVQLEEL